MPYDLVRAIGQADRILNWFDNLPEEDLPPEWMWPHDEELEEWFEDVKWRREQKYKGDSADTEVPMMENELVKERKGRG